MISWIVNNVATVLVSLVLIVIVALVIGIMIKDKKNGKSSCGGNCTGCPYGGSCDNKTNKK